jgi:EAL domain-containing protein (putative c-di-GMP-specific phosphodiesterase class I)
MLEQVQLPLAVKGILVDPDFSVGIAMAPEDGDSFEQLLQHADVAMYRAKDEQGRVARYEAQHDPHDPARLALLGDLRAALPGPGDSLQPVPGLELHYQPKAGLPLGEVRGVEALLRWNHPVLGPLPPDDFVPHAERTGLIGPLTRWVLETACRQLGEWRRSGHPLSVAINVPARVLLDPRFPDDVARACARNAVNPRSLVVEITERTLVGDHGRAQHALGSLASLGVRLSLDDFGTGYSSMAYLGRLPLHELKIDRCFVAGLNQVTSDAAIVTAAVDIGRSLGLEVVAEGVEDAATHASITRLGCTSVQGFFVARPMPASELTGWLDNLPVVQPEPSLPDAREPDVAGVVTVRDGHLT